MGNVLDLQKSIGRGGRDVGGKYQVVTIWEGIRLAKHIIKKVLKVVLQANEDMDKVKSRDLTETSTIKAEVQSIIALVKKKYQGQRRVIKTLTSEVKRLKIGIIDAPRLYQWSEDMDFALTPVLELLGKRMNILDINDITVGGGVGIGISEITALEDK